MGVSQLLGALARDVTQKSMPMGGIHINLNFYH